MPEEDVSVTARIPASPDVLYDLVSDVTRMGEWSGCRFAFDVAVGVVPASRWT